MHYNNLLVNQNGPVMTITINRPKKLNALNKETIQELHEAFQTANTDTNCRVIILTGSGEKAFVAGADISEFADFSKEEGTALAAHGQDILFDFVAQLNKPVIAAINGFALGGGLELAMAAHIRIAATDAKMGLPEVSLGVIPGYGGTQRLPELVGKGHAFELIFTGGMIDATRAQEINLVNHVVPLEALLPLAEKIASKIVKNSGVAIAAAMQAVRAGSNQRAGYLKEIEAFGNCFATADFKEGTTAFLEKRKPNFPNK